MGGGAVLSWLQLARAPLSTHHRRHLGFEAQSAALQVVGKQGEEGCLARDLDSLDPEQGVGVGEAGCEVALRGSLIQLVGFGQIWREGGRVW